MLHHIYMIHNQSDTKYNTNLYFDISMNIIKNIVDQHGLMIYNISPNLFDKNFLNIKFDITTKTIPKTKLCSVNLHILSNIFIFIMSVFNNRIQYNKFENFEIFKNILSSNINLILSNLNNLTSETRTIDLEKTKLIETIGLAKRIEANNLMKQNDYNIYNAKLKYLEEIHMINKQNCKN